MKFKFWSSARLPRWMQRRELPWFVGGMAAMAIFTATAQYTGTTQSDANCELGQAAQSAVNNKVQMIGLTAVDPSKFFQVGSGSSCIGDFSLMNFDFSNLIPDVMGLISSAMSNLVDSMINRAVSAACTVARQSVGNVIGTYNNAVTMVQGAPQTMIDSSIGQASSTVMNNAAMSWNTSGLTSGSSNFSLSGLSGSSSSTSSAAPTAVNTYLGQIQNSAAGFTAAASSLATAKMNLDQANSVVASYANNPNGVPSWATDQQKAAKDAYDKAQATYDASRSQVTAPVAASASQTSVQSVGASSTSTGGSVLQ